MEHVAYLPEVVVLLAAAVFIVIIFKRLNLSPVLGYLVAGMFIGENGFAYVDSSHLTVFAEFGVVFLLFAIGLELTIERLMAMRWHVFGFGTAQVFITGASIALITHYFFALDVKTSIVIGGSLALSSTAIVMRVLIDNKAQHTQVGRLALANLILQDLAVVPLLVVVPLLAAEDQNITATLSNTLVKTTIVLVVIFVIGRVLLRPLFNLIASTKSNELFMAATLFIVLGTSLATEQFGLSLAMGAFIAGLLVAETQYQHQVEENIMPFKDLLLGLFFMTVGMRLDIGIISEDLPLIILIALTLIVLKAYIITGLSKLFRFPWGSSFHAGLLLAQGGEFAFILFNLAAQEYNLIPTEIAEILLMVVTITMALTPALSSIGAWLSRRLDIIDVPDGEEMDDMDDLSKHVVIIGFGKVGEMVATLVSSKKVPFVAVDMDATRVRACRKKGFPVYHGDVTKNKITDSLGLDRAKAVIITIPDDVYVKKCIRNIHNNFPDVPIVVRAEDLRHAKRLYKLGATIIVPEKYEAGLQLAGALLNTVGVTEFEISQMKNFFRRSNYEMAQANSPE